QSRSREAVSEPFPRLCRGRTPTTLHELPREFPPIGARLFLNLSSRRFSPSDLRLWQAGFHVEGFAPTHGLPQFRTAIVSESGGGKRRIASLTRNGPAELVG